MPVSTKRLVHIIACMAFKGVELVDDIANRECYIYFGRDQKSLSVTSEEVYTLSNADIIEVDGGSDEEGHELVAYRLTETAIQKVQVLVNEELKKRNKRKKIS